jgi:hypothetical protein
MGLAEGLLSTGAMDPSMLQYAGAPLASARHSGAFSATAETGSPMEDTGMLAPSFSAVQSDAAITLFGGAAAGFAGCAKAPTGIRIVSANTVTFIESPRCNFPGDYPFPW